MPWKFGQYFEPDEIDLEMERAGWLNEVEASNRLGMPLAALRSMADGQEIELVVVKGRRYFKADSVNRRLARCGYPSREEQRLAYIDSLPPEVGQCGSLGQERNEILRRMQEQHNAQMIARGHGPLSRPASSEHGTVSRDAAADFVRKFGGGR
jgi:hypothetical protein